MTEYQNTWWRPPGKRASQPCVTSALAPIAAQASAPRAALPGRPRQSERGGNDDGGVTVEFTAELSFSIGDREQIEVYYTSNPTPGLEALPPGQRKNLGRGKPMPPGIAKRFVPDALRFSLSVPPKYDVIMVGWDVLLVEVATGIIHDVLMDVIR